MVNIGAISRKWSEDILLILDKGAKRFNQLMELTNDTNKKINSRALANNLRILEEEKLIVRKIIQERPPSTIYKLTEKGKKIVKLIIELNKI